MAEKKKPAKKKAAKSVVAKSTARIVHKDGSTLVYAGASYDASHPAVKAQPDMFDDQPASYEPYVAAAGRRGVERATAAPGEKRG